MKLRSSRRTSIPFIQDDHDFYTLVPKGQSPSQSPLPSPTREPPPPSFLFNPSLPSSVPSSPSVSRRPSLSILTSSTSSSRNPPVIDVAHSLGLPEVVGTPDASPITTPISTPLVSRSSTPPSSSFAPIPAPPVSLPPLHIPSFPAPTSTTKATQVKTTIASYCKEISRAIDSELLSEDDPIPVLERAASRIGKCFDTLYNARSRDINSASQLEKGIPPLSSVMEKVVRTYVQKAGDLCLQSMII